MKIVLSETEVARAVQRYVAMKTGAEADSCAVQIHWRGKTATVQVPHIPVLSDMAEDGAR